MLNKILNLLFFLFTCIIIVIDIWALVTQFNFGHTQLNELLLSNVVCVCGINFDNSIGDDDYE